MSSAWDVPGTCGNDADVTIVGPFPLPVAIDQTGTNNDVEVINGPGAAAVNIQDGGNSITVDGTLTIIPSGTQDVNIVSTIPIPVTDNGGSLTVDGTVAISNFPAIQPVSGTVTANQGTTPWIVDGSGSVQPVSGTINIGTMPEVEIKNDIGNPIPVNGTVSVTQGTTPWIVDGSGFTQPVSGTVAVSNFPATQNVAVTSSVEIEIKNDVGNPIPVTGTVIATPSGVQDVNLVSTIPVPVTDNGGSLTVDGVFFQAIQPVSGTVTSNIGTTGGLALDATLTNGTQLTQVTNFPASVEVSNDVGNPIPVNGTVTANQGTSPWVISGAVTNTPPANQSINLEQLNAVDLGSPSAYGTSPGAVSVPGVNAFITNTPAVTLASTTITGNVTVVQPTGTNLHVVVDSVPTTVVIGNKTNNNAAPGATNVGTLPAVATAANPSYTEGNQVAESVDLTGRQRVKAGGAVTTAAPTYVDGTTNDLSLTVAGALRVDGSGVTQPISAVSLPLPTGAATQTTLATLVTGQAATATVTRVNSSNVTQQLVALNTSRKMLIFYNDSTGQQFIKFGTTASQTSFTVRMTPQSYYELPIPCYTGRVDVICTNNNGAIQVTELT